MSRLLSNGILILAILVGVAVLSGLGSWQVKRLHWKEALIEEVAQRTSKPPVEIIRFLSIDMPDDEREYRPVRATGEFDHKREVFFYATGPGGAVGWNVHTPLRLADGRMLIVNRGFVPDPIRAADRRPAGQVSGPVTVTGLFRSPRSEKANRFIPDNSPAKREFYWRSFEGMRELMAPTSDTSFVPAMLDADETENPGGFPIGGTAIVSFSNNHLQYAVTWFGLAGALLAVGAFFMYSRFRHEQEQKR